MRFKDFRDLKHITIDDSGVFSTDIDMGEVKQNIYESKTLEINAKINSKKGKIIKIHEKCDSFRHKKHRFNNHIEKKCQSDYCMAIQKIARLAKQGFCSYEEIPFTTDEERLSIGKRHRELLSEGQIYNHINGEIINKGTYIDAASSGILYGNKRNQPIRIFYIDKEDVLEIVLVDLYHLFATSDHSNYKTVCGYNIKMSDII